MPGSDRACRSGSGLPPGSLGTSYEQQVDELRENQTTAILQERRNSKDELIRTVEKLTAAAKGTHEEADQLLHTVVLDSPDIVRVRAVKENVAALLVRLRLMKCEASAYFGNGNENVSFAALIIREQPPPRVLFTTKVPKELGKVVVELITPTKCEILSPVTLTLCAKSGSQKDVASIKSLQGPLILGDKQEVDGNNTAVFDQLKLNSSTRMVCSVLRFSMSTKTTLHSNKEKTKR